MIEPNLPCNKLNYFYNSSLHKPIPNKIQRAVLIVRNPLNCFMSELNRMLVGSCLKYAPLEKVNKIKDLNSLFFEKMFPAWMSFHHKILHEFHRPLLLIEYEELKINVVWELTKVLRFLDQQMNDPIAKCILQNQSGPYKRPKRPKEEEMLIQDKIDKNHVKLYTKSYNEIVKKLKIKFHNM